MRNPNEEVYLGDGLYAEFDGWQIELYASNGMNKTNRVYLEPAVLVSFLRYIDELKAHHAKPPIDAPSEVKEVA